MCPVMIDGSGSKSAPRDLRLRPRWLFEHLAYQVLGQRLLTLGSPSIYSAASPCCSHIVPAPSCNRTCFSGNFLPRLLCVSVTEYDSDLVSAP